MLTAAHHSSQLNILLAGKAPLYPQLIAPHSCETRRGYGGSTAAERQLHYIHHWVTLPSEALMSKDAHFAKRNFCMVQLKVLRCKYLVPRNAPQCRRPAHWKDFCHLIGAVADEQVFQPLAKSL